MKLTTKIFAGATALAFVTLAGSLQAQVTNVVTVSFTATEQDTTTNDNGTVSTVPAPKKHSVNTATILGWLAADTTNIFSAGSKLVVVGDGDFQVLDKHDNFEADVASLLSVTDSGVFGAEIFSGKSNDTNNLADPTTTKQEVDSITYNDIATTGNYLFSFSGVITSTTTDTKPNATTGNYKETQSHTMSSGQGDGMYEGIPFVITGASLHAGGSAELSDTNNISD